MTEQKSLVPKRRFKEFHNTHVWEQRKLSDVVDLMDGDRGKNYPSGDDFSEQGHTLFLSATNVTKDGFSFESEQYITQEKSNALGNGKLELNDIVLTSRGSLGHVAWYNKDIKLLVPFARVNSGMLILRSKEDVEPSYIAQYLKSPIGKRQLDLMSFGSAQPQLTKKDVSNYKISIPEKTEQAKLGEFFKRLDNLITLHQRKLEKTKALKSAYLFEMFPTEGEREPKRRFAGFTGAWEQRKLGDLSESFEYGLNAAATTFDGVNKYIRITDIDDETRLFKTDDVTSPNTDLSLAERYKLKEGDILFARTGASVGKTYIYRSIDGLVYYAGFLIRARIKSDIVPEFVFQNTLTSSYDSFIKITSQRSGQPGVNAQEYSEYKILVPSKEEQEQIGDFFKQLDHLITLHQRKLEKLQSIKKAYLNEMFV